MASMDPKQTTLMSFPSLDETESALDWIGVDFAEVDGAFEGELVADDREALDDAIADEESPEPVRDLARALLALRDDGGDGTAWRVVFEA